MRRICIIKIDFKNTNKNHPTENHSRVKPYPKNYIAEVSSLSDYDKKRTLPISVKIKIAFAAAASYRALSLKSYAAHISENTVIAQTESACQLSTTQQFAVFQ